MKNEQIIREKSAKTDAGSVQESCYQPRRGVLQTMFFPGLQKIVSEIFPKRQLVRPGYPLNSPIPKAPGKLAAEVGMRVNAAAPRPSGQAAAFETSLFGPIPAY